MRRLLPGCAVVALLVPAPGAGATVTFSSVRCEDAADYEARGRKPLFAGDPSGFCQQAIWRVEDDGSGLRRLTTGVDGDTLNTSGDGEPAWSPDGRTIVFTRSLRAAAGGTRLFAMRGDGSEQRRLSQSSDEGFGFELSPSFSPDGASIIFTSSLPNGGTHGGFVALMNADGSGIRRVDLGPGSYFGPAWAPDRARIAFVRDTQGDSGTPGLHTANADGTGQRRLTHGDLGVGRARVEFGPDGENILFEAAAQVMLVRADGRGVRSLARGGGATWIDARRVLFSGAPPGQPAGLFVVDALSGALRRLTTGPDGSPDWSGPPPPAPGRDRAGPAVVVAEQVWRGMEGARGIPPRGSAERLGYLAVDRAGVRRVEVALARRAGASGCRFYRGGRFTARRPCRRLVWSGIRSGGAWRRQVRGLPEGRYIVRFRATDAGGRASRTRALAVSVAR